MYVLYLHVLLGLQCGKGKYCFYVYPLNSNVSENLSSNEQFS